MSLKNKLGSAARAIGRLPVMESFFYHPAIRSTIQSWPGFQKLYGVGWNLLHPFDRFYGTDTSGFVPSAELPSSPYDSAKINVYGGSQPSIIRSALKTLPSLEGFTFLDLGCGKGRPLLVASEFPFQDIVGVELSTSLAAAARKNAAVVKKRFPGRPALRIEVGDASIFPLPAGDLVVFLYNPFGAEVVLKMVANIEAGLAGGKRSLYVVYYNPVHGRCFDASPKLSRYFAVTLPYAPEERGYGPDEADTVVIWQGGSAVPPLAGADAKIILTKPGIRADLSG
jgi:SAM-dependent methyltransferase